MKNKVKKLELKKLIQEYNYLLTDETYKQEVVSETKSDFLKEIHEKKVELGLIEDKPYIPEVENKKEESDKEDSSKKEEVNVGEENKNKEQQQSEDSKKDSINEEEKIIDSSKKEKSPKVKKLYREIVKKTHPDKDKTEKYIDLYKEATSAYEKNDITALIFICSKLDIEVDLEENDIETITLAIKEKKKELHNIEMSYLWLWYNAKTQEQRDKVVELFISKMLNKINYLFYK
jgi:hypothetical protein